MTSVNMGVSVSDPVKDMAVEYPVFGRRNLIASVALFVGALLALFALQRLIGIGILSTSNEPQYLYEAQSLMHGHLALDINPATVDVIVSHGKHYVVYPPFPALILIPFVAIWGTRTSDVLFTAINGALDLPLLFLFFEQVRANGLTRRPWRHNMVLAVLLYFGSIHLWLSLAGRIWMTAHIMCFTLTLLSLFLALRRHYTWSAIALACAFFCRGTVALGFPFLLYLAWQDAGRAPVIERFLSSLRARRPDWSAIPWRRLAPPVAVGVVMVLLFMVRNFLMFQSPLESGYNLLLQQRYPEVTHGVFNVVYIPANIIANFFTFPLVTFTGPYDRHPLIDIINHGDAVNPFFTTPLFLLLFWRNRNRSQIRAALWATIGLFVVAVLCFHAAGFVQFGARYLFDAYPYAFFLLVCNEIRMDWRVAVLGLLGIVFNVLGAYEIWSSSHVLRF